MKFITNLKKFFKDEKGSLDNLTWVIGSAVVVVLIVVVMMVLAPEAAEEIFNNFVDYAQSQFGI